MSEISPFNPALVGLVGLLGLVSGSFASALSHRLPRHLNFTTDQSRCPHCNHTLGPLDLVPVASWVLLGGRCRYCRTPISWRYPAIELTTCAAFLAAWWRGGGDITDSLILALIGLALMVITITDLEFRIIPDAVLIALLPLGLLWHWRQGGHWIDAGLGLVVGPAVILPVRALFAKLRGRTGLGMGDVKLIAVAGLLTGVTGLPAFLVIGGILGLVFGLAWRLAGRGPAFPFGPALVVSLFLRLVAPDLNPLPMVNSDLTHSSHAMPIEKISTIV